jgi:hypothetical protein
MRYGRISGNIACALALACFYVLAGCLDKDNTQPLQISTASLPQGTVNQSYSTSVSGSGGKPPYTWAVAPTLPANLSLNGATGGISGTPTGEGSTSLTFTLFDSSSPPIVVQKALALTIKPTPAPLSITTTSLPNGSVGKAYSEPVQATGGTVPLTWNLMAGALPPNLDLNGSTGVISGTPPVAGTSSFTIRVADTAGQEATQDLSIRINPPSPPDITTLSLPGGTVSLPYSETLVASGGIGGLVWSLSAGSLPDNLSIDPSGTISGTPTLAGTSNFTVRVTDSVALFDTQALSIAISAALAITTPSPLPDAEVGKAYNRTLQRSGGVLPFTWSVTPALPAGLNLEASTGKISGTPASGTDGTHTLTFTVKDSTTPTPQTVSKPLSLKVKP